MATGHALFRASVRSERGGPLEAGSSLRRAGRRIETDLLDSFAAFTPTALRTVRLFAPHRSGRLERGIDASVRSYAGRIAVTIYAAARSDQGFDYLPVTRFGHRVAFIYAKRARFLRFFPKTDPTGGGQPIYRRFVHGYKPVRDWVATAFDALDRQFAQLEDDVGRKLDRTLS